MQKDGHHTATYVAACAAGFPHEEAETIAYAAQYVDDATNDSAIQFRNSEYMYARIASAHKMIDYNNLIDVENHLSWLPFHFLPGNGDLPHGEHPQCPHPHDHKHPECHELSKLVCTPDSHVARDMLRAAFRDKGTARQYQRLGIAMHVYADTFAHQGFIGALSKANHAEKVTSGDKHMDHRIRLHSEIELVSKALNKSKALLQLLIKSVAVMFHERKFPIRFWKGFIKTEPLGHAAVNTFPDQPYLTWQYRNASNETVHRDNPATYLQAINMMVRAMRAWRADDETMALEKYAGLSPADEQAVERLIREQQDPDEEVRHQAWVRAIASGAFSFGTRHIEYKANGTRSWRGDALKTSKLTESGHEVYEYHEHFLGSKWKLFHDAIHAHRIDVVHDILPKYGICAA